MASLNSPQWYFLLVSLLAYLYHLRSGRKSTESYHFVESANDDIRSLLRPTSDPNSDYRFLLKRLLLVCVIIVLGTFVCLHRLHDQRNVDRPDFHERMRSEWEQERKEWEREVKAHEDQQRKARTRWE